MKTAPLTLRAARTYASLAAAATVVASVGLGAVTTPAAGALAGLAAVAGVVATVRAAVTCPA